MVWSVNVVWGKFFSPSDTPQSPFFRGILTAEGVNVMSS
jgi:hypothetical protein